MTTLERALIVSGLSMVGLTSLAQVQGEAIPVLNGATAIVTNVEILSAPPEDSKPPYRTDLIATVTYNAICDTPLSFVAIKKSNLDFEIYETRNQTHPVPIACQAEYLVTKKISLAHYFDIHPNATLIKVNGVGVSH